MNTKSIFSALQVLSLFFATIFMNAQSLTFSTLPNNVELGSSPSFNLNYTSNVPCKISVALYVFDVDGDGNLTPDWGSWKAGSYSATLAAATTETPYSTTLTVPSSLVPSSGLASGKTYVWALTLTDSGDNWITGGQYAVTIVPSSEVTDQVSFAGTLPTSVEAGSNQSISYQYTASEDRLLKIGLSKYDASGNWIGDIVSEIVNPAAATTTTPVSGTANLTIPADATPSANLTNGEFYKWEATIATTGWDYIGGTTENVTVVASTMTVSNTDVKKNNFYPNPAVDLIHFTNLSEIKTVSITDLSGRMIKTETKNFSEGLNVSTLKAGVYIITINGAESHKLIKK